MLVGNAGVLGVPSPLGHVEPKDWDNMMAVNVTANWQLIRCMDPLLKRASAGRAVFLTSGLSWMARPYFGAYAASKAALEALVRTYAAECATTNVRVNLFSPGRTRTRMMATAFPGVDPQTLPRQKWWRRRSCRCACRTARRAASFTISAHGEVSGVSAAGLVLALGAAFERIVLLAQRQPDRRARQVEGLAQRINQVAFVGIGQRVGARAEQARSSAAGSWPA